MEKHAEENEEMISNGEEIGATDVQGAVVKIEEPKMSVIQKIILCLMSAALLFGAVSLHEAVPLIGFFAYFIYPIVVANLTYRYGYIMSIGAMVIAHCFSGMLWDVYVARAATISVGAVALLFGFCLRKGYTGKRTFFTVTGVFTGAILLLQLLPLSTGGVLGAIVEEAYMQTVFARKLIGSMGAAFVADSFMMSSDIPTGLILAVFRFMIPTIFIFQQAFLIWLYYLAIGFAMKEMGREVATMPALATWQAPRWLLWTALVGAVLDCFVPFRAGWFSFLCVNIVVFSVLFFMACGIGVFWYYVRYGQVSWFLKVVAVVVVIYFLSYGLGAAMLIGVLDTIFDFRKLKQGQLPVPAVTEGAAAVEWEAAQMSQAVESQDAVDVPETEKIEKTENKEKAEKVQEGAAGTVEE